jgi:hypothetical protein
VAALAVILFAIASALLLLVLAACAFATIAAAATTSYRSTMPLRRPPLSVGLLPTDIRRLLSFAFTSTRGCVDDETITDSPSYPVCLDVARVEERRRVMPAFTHTFHTTCIDRWSIRTPILRCKEE